MGLLFVAMLETYPGLQQKCYCGFVSLLIMSRNRCMGSVPSEKIVGATTSEHCLVAKKTKKYKGLSNEVLNTIKPTYLELLCTKRTAY
ncbi:hypothetical protein TNCV_24051 [Trichonephila clavipes]|nr:hypothetical protein TNCV_24051 [Trichonephila clavipes]